MLFTGAYWDWIYMVAGFTCFFAGCWDFDITLFIWTCSAEFLLASDYVLDNVGYFVFDSFLGGWQWLLVFFLSCLDS